MSARCDLHMHSTASDGTLPAADLVRAVHGAGVSAFALTDHDDVSAWPEVAALASELGIDTLPGVEVSSRTGDLELHILGYGFDPDHDGLREMFETLRVRRRERLPAIVDRLAQLGVRVELAAVERIAGQGSAGRPHVARALVEAGHCRDVDDAFARYLGDGKPAHVRKPVPTSARAIEMIHEAGGVAVWAHACVKPIQRPGGLAGLVAELARAGLDGLEVLHPVHGPNEKRRLRRLARQHDLLQTGGSDYHGSKASDVYLGHGRDGEGIPLATFEALRERIESGR